MANHKKSRLASFIRAGVVLYAAIALTGCSLLTGSNGSLPDTPAVTSIIPVTGDEQPGDAIDLATPVPGIVSGAAENSVDLNAFTNALWVDGKSGNDANSGTTAQNAFRTIQRAADLAGPSTVVRIMPGVYRESIVPAASGTSEKPILYLAEKGLGTVFIRGSEPSSSLVWTQLQSNSIGLPSGVNPANIYYADLSSWGLEDAPHFLAVIGAGETVSSTLTPAREPDWQPVTEWKYSEFWWMANGGSAVAGCDPTTDSNNDCDMKWRSYKQLTDTLNDTDPVGVESGNLKSLPSLIGATLVAMDAQHSHYVYRRSIVAHDTAAGRITVDENCNNDGTPGLGWGSKYYVENHPALLDQAGEWWYDKNTGRLYLWSPTGGNPSGIDLEISRLDTGVDLSERSYIYMDGLQIELFNANAFQIDNISRYAIAKGNQLRNSRLLYANRGVLLHTYISEPEAQYAIDGFLLENSEIGFMDTTGFESTYWWDEAPTPVRFTHSGIRNLVIRNNLMHHLGFNSRDRSAVGVRIFFPDQISFSGNHLHHVAQNGMHLHQSVIDSTKVYDLSPSEILIGGILIKDNLFEDICLASSDCGGLKISGGNRPYTHVFRDLLVVGNIFRNNFGWSYVSILRGLNDLGDGNGFYLDYASGVHLYRNIAFNNSGAGFKLSCLWRDGDAVLYNNIAANNYLYGFKLTGLRGCDDHNGSVNTRLVNNIIMNNGLYGIQFNSAYENQYGNLVIDYNLYFQNGWNNPSRPDNAYFQLFRASLPTEYFESLAEIKAKTVWEDHGQEGNPFLTNYDASDNSIYTYVWPDFYPTKKSSHILDRGPTFLSGSLFSLASRYAIDDALCGRAYEIGRFEFVEPLYEGSTCSFFNYVFLPMITR